VKDGSQIVNKIVFYGAIIILAAILVLFANRHHPPQERFFHGNVVVHKLTKEKGVVVGKTYLHGHDGKAHDVWKYDVRFANRIDVVYEFEIEPKMEQKNER